MAGSFLATLRDWVSHLATKGFELALAWLPACQHERSMAGGKLPAEFEPRIMMKSEALSKLLHEEMGREIDKRRQDI